MDINVVFGIIAAAGIIFGIIFGYIGYHKGVADGAKSEGVKEGMLMQKVNNIIDLIGEIKDDSKDQRDHQDRCEKIQNDRYNEMSKKLTEVDARSKSNTHRLDKLDGMKKVDYG